MLGGSGEKGWRMNVFRLEKGLKQASFGFLGLESA